jgi:F420-dependent oxidoreductase-like protein
MRFSYWASSQQPWSQILASARHVEATGWDGVWVADHFMPGYGSDTEAFGECWTTLAALAAAVPRVRLGPLVTGNTYRHPAVLANMAATTDEISEGRLVLGLGAGWQENEHRAYGLDYGTVGSRLDRLEEACAVIRGLFTQERTNFDGEHYALRDAPMAPKGAGGRLVPLLIGGGGEQRTMRIAARYADEWNIWGTPEKLAAKGAVLDQRCAEVDRDPATIARSAVAMVFLSENPRLLERFRAMELPRPSIVGTPGELTETLGAYRDAGVDELVVPDFNLADPVQRHEVLDQFITEVAPAVA